MKGAGKINTYCGLGLSIKVGTGIDPAPFWAGIILLALVIPLCCAAMCVACCCNTNTETTSIVYPMNGQVQMVNT
jgi:hypothetical protein